jgi:hypothetical protein
MAETFRTFIGVAALALTASCASTGVVPMDHDTYMIARRSGQAGLGPPVHTKAKVYREASAFARNRTRPLRL